VIALIFSTMDTDVLVVGAGLAGLSAAFYCKQKDRKKDVLVVSLPGGESCTRKAQGGIAAAIGASDSHALHARDTVVAGNGLCNKQAVELLVKEGTERVRELMKLGLEFDDDLGMEAAHSRNRILHIGDFTGENALNFMNELTASVDRLEGRAVSLLSDGRQCGGALIETRGGLEKVRAPAVVLASGGFAAMYSHTTNPETSIGDGMLLAFQAGAELMDLEFVQFHPTVFNGFLLSEALRGEGAVLINSDGERFMKKFPAMELSPRDVVARAIQDELSKRKKVFLDATGIDANFVRERFSNIYTKCLELGVDITREPVPVKPAAHYTIGGVKTDLKARTRVRGLFACGEVACTGVDGSNRLASNSLLAALVFGARAGEETVSEKPKKVFEGAPAINRSVDDELRNIMWEYAGVIRSEKGLRKGLELVTGRDKLAEMVFKAALQRKESRGSHYRQAFPGKLPAPRHSVFTLPGEELVRGPRIAVFGGSFNPVHNGHVAVVKCLLKEFDEVWLVPCNKHAFGKKLAPARHRLEMLHVAVKGLKRVLVSDVEIKRKGTSYTIDTLEQLKQESPGKEFYWVINSNALPSFDFWKNSERLKREFNFVIVSRKPIKTEFGRLLVCDSPKVSGSIIRQMLREGRSVKGLVPGGVERYVKKHGLYA